MKLPFSYVYSIALLLSFAHISARDIALTTERIETTTINEKTSEQENAPQPVELQEPTLADHLKHVLTAGLIHTCETHHIDELNAHIYSPENDGTFSSAVRNNGNGLVDRMKRITGGEPTISISGGVVITSDETKAKKQFTQAMLKFAENGDLPCKKNVDCAGNTIIACTIVMTLKEFYALKEEYNNSDL